MPSFPGSDIIKGMEIKFLNTASKKKEVFEALSPSEVRIYNCGPTVHSRQHIGNLRSAVTWDILRRVLEYNGYSVTQVVNITDFGHLSSDADEGEDKMVKGLKRENLSLSLESMRILAEKYSTLYMEDRKKINALEPTHTPFASEHTPEYIRIIEILEKKGFVYKTSDGLYFDTKKDPQYGKLAPKSQKKNTYKRIKFRDEKRNSSDFALWKFNADFGWQSPWGQGFPGWHIECSGMSQKYLGDTFDIHTGGVEHIPIHHTNEIAQSENATGKMMARFWLHNEHLILRGDKMAKSDGNVILLPEIEEKGISPLSLRFLFLQAHYRSAQEFSWDALIAADRGLQRLKETVQKLKGENGVVNVEYQKKFNLFINDDLDTPKAAALLYELVSDKNVSDEDKKATIKEVDKVLGLKLEGAKQKTNEVLPENIKKIMEERETTRANKNWKKSDELREEMSRQGFEVLDTKDGPIIKKKG